MFFSARADNAELEREFCAGYGGAGCRAPTVAERDLPGLGTRFLAADKVGIGRIVALYHRSPTLYQIC